MSNIDKQVEGILLIHNELSDGIIDVIDELDGGDTSDYSDMEKQAVLMGFMVHFSEVLLSPKAVINARDAFISKNSLLQYTIQSFVDDSYHKAVRTTKSLGSVNLSVYDVSMAHARAIIDQFGWSHTEKNISLIAGHLVLAINELHSLSKSTGGVKAGGGKKKLLILAFVVILAILLFTVGPLGNHSKSNSGNEQRSADNSYEPMYEQIGDIQFQVNVNDHMFMEAKSYKDLSFANITDDGNDLSDEDKSDIWDSITYGDEYSSDEKIYQDYLTNDLIDFVIIDIGGTSQISDLDDYISWKKENFDGFDRIEDFTLDDVHACKVYTKTEESESVEIVFIYDDRFYLIRPISFYEDDGQYVEDIIEGIELKDSNNNQDAISWKDAGDYVGETVIVKGKIAEVTYSPESSGRPVFIDIGEAYPAPGRVTATIWEEDQDNFNMDPDEFESYYSVGDTIYVLSLIHI